MKRYRTWMRQRGVTLIELLIVIVIVAILSAIAVPSYRKHVIRVTRTDAKRELLARASQLERCFTRTNDYTRVDDAGTACAALPYTNPEGTYTISVSNYAAGTFTLTATPQGQQAKDTECKAFTIDQLGNQGVTGTSSATPQGCWAGRAK